MSGYLTDAAHWLRSAGLQVVEYGGWQSRARSSGGFAAGRPWGVMWHHTASQTSPENDASYMCHGSGDRPIANVLIARDGAVWLLAAGATNTNGKGSNVDWSKGRVPNDNMNLYAWGMELANSGVGEQYPRAQIDAAFEVSNTMNAYLGNRPDDCALHYSWAPDRKIDPATANAVEGPWQPRADTSSGTWALMDVINECQHRSGSAPLPPQPTPGDDDVRQFIIGYAGPDTDGALYATDEYTKQWLTDQAMVDGKTAVIAMAGGDPSPRPISDRNLFKGYGIVVGPQPERTDAWGLPT